MVFDVNDELRKEVFLILINAAKPIVVGNHFDARDPQNFVAVGKRQRLDDGDAIDDDQTIRARDVCASAKSILHNREKCEKEQGHCEGAYGEQETNFLAEKISEDQAAKFHAIPPAATRCCSLDSTRTPFSRWSVVSA